MGAASGVETSRRTSLDMPSPLGGAPKAGARYESLFNMIRQASPLGMREVVLLGVLVKVYALVYVFSRVHHYTLWKFFAKLLWKNAATRPPVLIVLILLGWSWVVRTCNGKGIELELVLGGPTKPPAMAISCALVLVNIFLSIHLVHLLSSEVPGLTWRPWLLTNALLHVAYVLVIATPHRWLHADARGSLLRTAWDSFRAPFCPVTFWHVLVTDYATSLAKAFADFQLMLCSSYSILSLPHEPGAPYVRTTVLWEQMHPQCVNQPLNGLLLALPFWLRMMQCLHMYAKTKETKQLWCAHTADRRSDARAAPCLRAAPRADAHPLAPLRARASFLRPQERAQVLDRAPARLPGLAAARAPVAARRAPLRARGRCQLDLLIHLGHSDGLGHAAVGPRARLVEARVARDAAHLADQEHLRAGRALQLRDALPLGHGRLRLRAHARAGHVLLRGDGDCAAHGLGGLPDRVGVRQQGPPAQGGLHRLRREGLDRRRGERAPPGARLVGQAQRADNVGPPHRALGRRERP